ncbi:MAG: TraX family protein [Bacillota bacterium]|nr:TraX family protein [Bacillota bacterium]
MNEDKAKGGLSSFIIRLVAYIILAGTTVLKSYFGNSIAWIEYLNWLSYPIFAFLLAEGFEQTSGKLRYFIRLLLFAIITEIPYNFLYGGQLFYARAQNGMFTLCMGYIVMCIINFVYQKTYNIIIAFAAMYVYGWGAFYITKYFNCEFYSFGVMFVLLFYVCNQIKYPKILQIIFMVFLAAIISTDAFVSFIIGNIQYTVPYRAIAIPAMILTWFYKGKRGPNSIGMKIAMYAFYPALLAVIYGLNYYGMIH